jgi:transcriptional regulator with XRE-family HTH domain
MTFGEKLRDLRLRHGLTQKELAKTVNIGYLSILNYENGKYYPKSTELLAKLAGALNVTVEYLIGENSFVVEASAKYGSCGARDANELIAQVNSLFAGGELTDDDKDAVFKAVHEAYWLAKEENKKHMPIRYRKKDSEREQQNENGGTSTRRYDVS